VSLPAAPSMQSAPEVPVKLLLPEERVVAIARLLRH
jgi:hypothetical protein